MVCPRLDLARPRVQLFEWHELQTRHRTARAGQQAATACSFKNGTLNREQHELRYRTN